MAVRSCVFNLPQQGRQTVQAFWTVHEQSCKYALQGINRLGKGTAKPGTLRPADPNRFKTEDFFSVDAEQDPEYLRRIVEVQFRIQCTMCEQCQMICMMAFRFVQVEQLAVNKTGSVLAKGGAARDLYTPS